jgi:hypothetical protein
MLASPLRTVRPGTRVVTPSHNADGLVVAADVLSALSAGPAVDPYLLLEIIHAHEADDEQVPDDLVTSVAYWREP